MQKTSIPIGGEALRPQARTEDLVTRELPHEELVYDLKTHQAYCLNKIATVVWKRCDGFLTITEITQAVSRDLQSEIDESTVLIALHQLSQTSLLEFEISLPMDSRSLSRRQALRKMGLAGLALPLIPTVIAPQAAYAASCLAERTSNVPCTNAAPTDPTKQCCSGCCKSNADRCEGNVGMSCLDDTDCCTGLLCRGPSGSKLCKV